MLDVQNGDVLALEGGEYPIKACEAWPWPAGTRGTLPFAVKTAAIKRSPAMSGGKRGEPAVHLTGITCTALYPASAEIMRREDLRTPHTLMQCYLDGGDTVYALVVEVLKR
jgi:hypothetical protein